ncbi:MAG TPA: hypothetical protein VK454_10205 [Myxococcaceae bacterium]|nr:hypothetical protein [Myxococcaceae bacterium]
MPTIRALSALTLLLTACSSSSSDSWTCDVICGDGSQHTVTVTGSPDDVPCDLARPMVECLVGGPNASCLCNAG